MEKIRKMIRKLLFEVHGKQVSVHNYTKLISNDVLDSLERNFTKINDGHTYELVSQTYTPYDIKKEIEIEVIKVRIDFKFSNEFEINGSFKPDNTILLEDDSYEVIIALKLQTDTLDGLIPKIESVISHELNHAFVYIKGLNGKLKANSLNKSNKITQGVLQSFLEENPALREFVNMIYLANPYEVQARIQQSASELKHINRETAEEAINALLQYNPLRDARIMIAYNLNEINKLDKEVLGFFVKNFNDNIKSFSKEENPKTIYETDKFFSYWKNVINNAGDKLARKIYKLVADKHQIHEGYVYEQTSSGAYRRVFGQDF